jgi:branched-chain amino acid transport system ATP-binding protein
VILDINSVSKRFGGLVALNQVNLQVQEGEIYGLIGPNGAGKTTLLNVVSGVYRPNGGAVSFAGADIVGLSPEAICRRGVARTFQISQPFPRMTAINNVRVAAVFGHASRVANPTALAAEMLDFVGFPMPKDTLALSLNTAHLKRLDMARALASLPKLLLLDEVASGLTPAELDEVMKLIFKIREKGVTIIAIEHVVKMIMCCCDRIAVLDHGEKIAEGTPQEIAHDPRVIKAYLGDDAVAA